MVSLRLGLLCLSPQALTHYITLFSLSFFPGLPSEREHVLCRSNADCPVPTDR